MSIQIIDDYCYHRGVSTHLDVENPYILVIGARAIGKSQYCKAMSQFTDTQYASFQLLSTLPLRIRKRAIKIIRIGEVSYERKSQT